MSIIKDANSKLPIRFANIPIIQDDNLAVFIDYKCKIDGSGNNVTKQLSKQYLLPLHILTTVHSS